jgi:hypothetical protein
MEYEKDSTHGNSLYSGTSLILKFRCFQEGQRVPNTTGNDKRFVNRYPDVNEQSIIRYRNYLENRISLCNEMK